MIRRILPLLDRQEWLEPVENGLQSAILGAYHRCGAVGTEVKNFLHGTWLGHSLHSALTDIPIGAWSTASLIDAISWVRGKRDSTLDRGADTAVVIGIIGALGAASAGLTDWSDTYGRTRRVGIVHATLNALMLAVYGLSWLLRRSGHRSAGRLTALLGFGGITASAWLGGEMVYGEAVMVNHTAWQEGPVDWVAVARTTELPESGMRRVVAQGVPVLLIRQAGRLYAIGETCPHAGGPLSEGTLDGKTITCPWHGSQFGVEDGALLRGPSTFDQTVYDVRVTRGWIEIREQPRATEGAAA